MGIRCPFVAARRGQDITFPTNTHNILAHRTLERAVQEVLSSVQTKNQIWRRRGSLTRKPDGTASHANGFCVVVAYVTSYAQNDTK